MAFTVLLAICLPLLAACGKDSSTAPDPSAPPPPPPPPPVQTRVEVTPSSVTLNAIGQTNQLTARVFDQNNAVMSGATVVWSSSDASVATVSGQGLVTAVSNGSATVTARSGSASASVPVTVMQSAGSIVIEPSSATLMSLGETVQLTATVLDGNGQPVSDATVEWSSSDASVATVSGQGLVTAVSNGSATVTARSGSASANVPVTVMQSAGSIAIEPSSVTLMALGETVQLTATVLDGKGQPVSDTTVEWSSSDASVATVSGQGLVTAVSNGSATITARSGSASVNVPVTVMQSAGSIAIEPSSVTLMALGETLQLSATVLDLNGQPVSGAAVEWSSSDEAVAAVSTQGLVTAVGKGSAQITARVGNTSAQATVYVIYELRGDREVLIAFYHSTKGPNWYNNTNWLSDLPLGSWHGVETNTYGDVTSLDLWQNNLSGHILPELGQLKFIRRLGLSANDLNGPIPPELGQARSLRELDLRYTELTGPIPPELGRLVYLEWLRITHARLTGPIPPELGQLRNLYTLNLENTELTGSIPSELGRLSNLDWLDLSDNQLTGPIPLALGQLRSLRGLFLENNRLSGSIPLELGRLGNLEWLNLNDTELSGPIPPELGRLGNLDQLNLSDNQLTGPIPPELGQLVNLEWLSLARNKINGNVPQSLGGLVRLKSLALTDNIAMSGVLPHALTNLDLEGFLLGGTQLCPPNDPGFQEWLRSIPNSRIASCDQGIGGSAVYLTQATQSLEYPVPLLAGEDALLRVFITQASESDADMPLVRAVFYERGAEVYTVDIPGSGTTIPSEIEEGDLPTTANARIPGRVLTPGLEVVVEIDPDGEMDPVPDIPVRLPPKGRMNLDIVDLPPFELTVIPFSWSEHPDESYLEQINGLTAASDLFRLTRDILPVGDFVLNVHDPVSISVDPVLENQHEVTQLTNLIATMEGGTGYYMGMLRSGGGWGELPGNISISSLNEATIAHELGHNLNLYHAPCGGVNGPDPGYPYPDGSIGAWGYDFLEGRLVDPNTPDLMSYCRPRWISDYSFNKALGYRLSQVRKATRLAAAYAPSSRSLLLWGGVGEDGELVLNPAFAVDAPASLPRLDGTYRITGEDQDGRTLFSLTFGMPALADVEGEGGSFAFVVPVRPDWPGRLSRITLTGPEGVATLGGEESAYDEDAPTTALLLDPGTGKVRGLLRDWPGPSTGRQAARRALPEPGLEVVISRGIPDRADW